MTEVALGEKVESVRAKVGLGDTDLLKCMEDSQCEGLSL